MERPTTEQLKEAREYVSGLSGLKAICFPENYLMILDAEVQALQTALNNPEGYWRGQWALEAQHAYEAQAEAARLRARIEDLTQDRATKEIPIP